MIFLYTLVLIALGAIKFLIDRRAGLLDQLVREPVYKDGNSSRFNPCQVARSVQTHAAVLQTRLHPSRVLL
jgi:hypothetical protein